jgi:hypothetical protein
MLAMKIQNPPGAYGVPLAWRREGVRRRGRGRSGSRASWQLSVQHSQEGHGCDARASRRYTESPASTLQLRWQLTQVMRTALTGTSPSTKGTTPAWAGDGDDFETVMI